MKLLNSLKNKNKFIDNYYMNKFKINNKTIVAKYQRDAARLL